MLNGAGNYAIAAATTNGTENCGKIQQKKIRRI